MGLCTFPDPFLVTHEGVSIRGGGSLVEFKCVHTDTQWWLLVAGHQLGDVME